MASHQSFHCCNREYAHARNPKSCVIVYTFNVHKDAHKTQVRQAVEQLFDVKVARVNIVKVQPKPKRRGVTKGTRPGWKKAIVQLREGNTIEIFEGAQV